MKAKIMCIAGLILSSLFLPSARLFALPFRLFTDASFVVPIEQADEDAYRYGVSCDVGCGATFFGVLDATAGIGFERVRVNTFAPSYLELPSAFAGLGLTTKAVPGLRLRAGAEAGIVFADYRFLTTMAVRDTASRVGFELSAAKAMSQARFEIEPFAGAQWYFLKPGSSSFYQELRAGIRINFSILP